MLRFLPLLFWPLAFLALRAQTTTAPVETDPLQQKIQGELGGAPLPDSAIQPNVPHGEFLKGEIKDPPMYPGTESSFVVYVPAQYDPAKPACLLLKLDGLGGHEGTVLDNLIASKEMPVTIGVGIGSGAIFKDENEPPAAATPAAPGGPKRKGGPKRQAFRWDRSYEFDSMTDNFADFVTKILLPEVEKMTTKDGRPIHLSTSPDDRMAMGGSTGGIGSFTLAWRRPDQFHRVYDVIGTFVSMRGGNDYPALIRKTEPKPIRIFLEDGSTDAWNPLFGSWFDANQNMESALKFAGYDVGHAWGTHGHDGRPGSAILPDVLRWLWRDYPAAIPVGRSQNSTLQAILQDNAGWQALPPAFTEARGLAANAAGDVYVSDSGTIFHLGEDGQALTYAKQAPLFSDEEFGPDGTLYGSSPAQKKIIAITSPTAAHDVATGVAGHSLVVTHDGTMYVSEPGTNNDSQLWLIKPNGEKTRVDQGLNRASALAFLPDHNVFLAAEQNSRWIYSYIVQPDGTLTDKQPFYYLHLADLPPADSGTEQIAVNEAGDIFVATPMGVQICDQNGRVRAILPLPSPSGPVRSLCFGGPHFNELYVTDGQRVFKRTLKVPGVPPWAAPQPFKSEGAG